MNAGVSCINDCYERNMTNSYSVIFDDYAWCKATCLNIVESNSDNGGGDGDGDNNGGGDGDGDNGGNANILSSFWTIATVVIMTIVYSL